MKTVSRALVAALAVVLTEFVSAPPAAAIVGAPLTPVSYAGVARRTTRRAVVATSAASSAAASESAAANQAAASQAAAASQSAAASAAAAESAAASANAAAAAAGSATVLASLPEGCAPAGADFRCGNVSYRPYMSGSTVVYVQVAGH